MMRAAFTPTAASAIIFAKAISCCSKAFRPAMIENVAKMAGMPVGPLALNDEVALDLALKIIEAAKRDLGPAAIDPAQENLLNAHGHRSWPAWAQKRQGLLRLSRSKGHKTLWPGLDAFQPTKLDPDTIDIDELKQRFLVTQAVEAARVIEDGVVTDPREADVGSIIGFGFAPFTGGTLSYIDGMGAAKFVALCERLRQKYGERFSVPQILFDMATTGGSFYGRFTQENKRVA